MEGSKNLKKKYFWVLLKKTHNLRYVISWVYFILFFLLFCRIVLLLNFITTRLTSLINTLLFTHVCMKKKKYICTSFKWMPIKFSLQLIHTHMHTFIFSLSLSFSLFFFIFSMWLYNVMYTHMLCMYIVLSVCICVF